MVVQHLKFNYTIAGAENINRSLAGVERRFVQHQKTMDRAMGVSAPGSRSSARRPNPGKGFAEIAKVAATIEKKRYQDSLRLEKRMHAEKLRNIKKEESARIRAEKKAAQVAEREAKKAIEAQRRFRRNLANNITGSAGGAIRGGGRIIAGGLALGGGIALNSAIQKEITASAAAARFVVDSRDPNGRDKFTQKEILDKANKVGAIAGFDTTEVIEGTKAFVTKTGDDETAIANMELFARVAKATGNTIEDVASASADLSEKFNIKSVDQMTDALATLTNQGKQGAFELSELAGLIPRLGAAGASTFGMTGEKGVRQLGAFAQIARTGTGSSEQATSSIENAFNALAKKATFLEQGKYGDKVSIYKDPKNKLAGKKDIDQLLPEIIASTGGDSEQLIKLFGAEGIRAINPMINEFNKAAKATSGSHKDKMSAGAAAVRKMFTDLMDVEGGRKVLDQDFDTIRNTEAEKLADSFREMNKVIAFEFFPILKDDIIPALKELAPHIGKAAKAVAKFASWFADNPISGIGAVIMGKVVADIGSASIGSAVSGSLEKAVGGSAVTTAVSGALVGAIGSAVGLLLADDQGGKLSKETGAEPTGSWWDMLPGFKNGEFDSDTLIEDAFNPIDALKRRSKPLDSYIQSVKRYEDNLNDDARDEYQKKVNEAKRQEAEAAIKADEELRAKIAELGNAASEAARQLKAIGKNKNYSPVGNK